MNKDLTIFSITNGRQSHRYSLQSVKEAASDVEIVVVENKSWLDALAYCVNFCRTQYFLRVDDDFIMHPKSILYIKKCIENAPKFGVLYWMLWETFTYRVRESIKVYSVDALKTIGGFHADPISGKVDRITNPMLEKYGYAVVSNPSVLALHVCSTWDDQRQYEKLWGHKKIHRDVMKNYNVSLEEQASLRNDFLDCLNKDRKTPFAKFKNSIGIMS